LTAVLVRCVECDRYSLRHGADRDMARLSGTCIARRPYFYMTPMFERECVGFIPASAELVASRKRWFGIEPSDQPEQQMSYCRFSSNNFRSDVYAYESCMGGYTVHVASNRFVGTIPQVPPLPDPTDKAAFDRWMAAHRAQLAWLETAEREAIKLPHAGETFNEPDLDALLARLQSLAAAGFCVPATAINLVLQEIALEAKYEVAA